MAGPSPRIRGESTGWQVQPRPCTDHPREYGENNQICLVYRARLGPSPRIRGESVSGTGITQILGTIPANTGRIKVNPTLIKLTWDHPREYGENFNSRENSCLVFGPSPRIRGESMEVPRDYKPPGTIPANTGRICFAR